MLKMENIVASTTFGVKIDLFSLSQKFENTEYKRGRFPGLIVKTKDPKATILIFSTGKIVCTGSKRLEDAKEAIERVVPAMRSIGIDIKEMPPIGISNIVASANLHSKLNLDAIAAGFGFENVEYEPEIFPGLIYRMSDPKAVVLLFGSGKMILTGCKRIEDGETIVEMIIKKLEDLGLLSKS
jgi:transcription initiation factor TFIID TATA-box-binding protein